MNKFRTILYVIFFYVLGLIFIFVPKDYIKNIYFTLVSLSLISIGFCKLFFLNYQIDKISTFILDSIEGILSSLFGVIFLNFSNIFILNLIIFIPLFSIQIIRLVLATKKINHFFVDFFKYVLLFSILGSCESLEKIILIVIGIIFLLLGTFVIILFKFSKKNKLNILI